MLILKGRGDSKALHDWCTRCVFPTLLVVINGFGRV